MAFQGIKEGLDFLGSIFEIGKNVWESTGEWVGYYKNLGTNMQNLKRKMDDLHRREQDINTELSSAERPWKRRKREVGGWLEDVQKARHDVSRLEQEARERKYISSLLLGKRVVEKIQAVVELHDNGRFPDGLLTNAPPPKTFIPTTKRFFCEGTSGRNLRNVWDCLMDDEFRRIGVYGMGGVGKTTLMHQINNWLLNDHHKFESIIWVTVSSAFSITKIQSEIAEKLDLDLSKFRHVTDRATLLHAMLSEKNKCLLILDDLWKEFALEEVGIPEPTSSNGCKLVITTRSSDVCRRMGCKPVKVEILTEQEALDLFMSELNLPTIFTPGVKEIAIKVAKECAQLPLAIITVAGSMKGVNDIREWRNALRELTSGRNDIDEDDEDVVYKRLKFSYSRLKNEKLQQCFLYCAMYPEDYRIPTVELIQYWIAEGLIAQAHSPEAMFDEGRAKLNKLINSCLLEESGYSCVRMHDLIREMALKIVGPRFLVHAGTGIEEVPDEVWYKDPEKVSLIMNRIKVLPSNPPIFHRLTTLLLNHNYALCDIPDSFFSQMPLLMVLDLSCNDIKSLPESLSKLENLQSLLVNHNPSLEYVPSLEKLKELKQLNLSFTTIREIPQGIEKLVKLKDLNLSKSGVTFPSSKLVGLFQLQRLKVHQCDLELLAEDLLCFGQLKVLCASLENMEELTKYIKSEQFSMLENYELFVNCRFGYQSETDRGNKISIEHVELSRSEVDAMVGSRNLKFLMMHLCQFRDMVSIFDIQSLNDARNLRRLGVVLCGGIESVFSSSSSYFSKNLRSVEEKRLSVLPNYRVPFNRVGTANNISINLKELNITGVHCIKNIFSVMLLQSFPNLTELSVTLCDGIEEIIIEEEGHNQNHNSSNSITLPNLRKLLLDGLPELESIYKGLIMACELEIILVGRCGKLRRLPLSPTTAPRLQIIQGHGEWWESLEWDDVHTKTIFEPLFWQCT